MIAAGATTNASAMRGKLRAIARVYAAGRVLQHEQHDGQVLLEAELPERALARYREHLA